MQDVIELLPWVLAFLLLLLKQEPATSVGQRIKALEASQARADQNHVYLVAVVADMIDHPPKGTGCTRKKIALEAGLEERLN